MRRAAILIFGVLPAVVFSYPLSLGLMMATMFLLDEPTVSIALHLLGCVFGLLGTVALLSALAGNLGPWTKGGLVLGLVAIVPLVLGLETEFMEVGAPEFRAFSAFPMVVAIGLLVESAIPSAEDAEG